MHRHVTRAPQLYVRLSYSIDTDAPHGGTAAALQQAHGRVSTSGDVKLRRKIRNTSPQVTVGICGSFRNLVNEKNKTTKHKNIR